MLTSKTDEWETPDELFNLLHKEFNFAIDLAATKENSKCGNYFLGPGSQIAEDSLHFDWDYTDFTDRNLWLNPPYSRGLQDKFVSKCLNLSNSCNRQFNVRVVALLPVRTSTKRWHAIAKKASFIYFLKKRLKFKTSDPTQKVTSAPFDSAIVGFNFNDDDLIENILYNNTLNEVGYLIDSFKHIHAKTF